MRRSESQGPPDTNRAVAGSTKYGAYFDGELFLFASPENRERFKKTPYRFTRTRHAGHATPRG